LTPLVRETLKDDGLRFGSARKDIPVRARLL
jgi:hypothetical protein